MSYWTARVTRVGVRSIDSLNEVFGVARAEVRYNSGLTQVELRFRQPVNVPFVLAHVSGGGSRDRAVAALVE